VARLFISLSKKASRYVNIEAFIGVLYIFSFSASILILDKSPHGLEEFKAIMNGNISGDPQRYTLNLHCLRCDRRTALFLRKQFYALTFEGKGGFLLELLFFSSLCCGARQIGAHGRYSTGILVSGLLPALIGRLFFKKPMHVLLTGWLVGVQLA